MNKSILTLYLICVKMKGCCIVLNDYKNEGKDEYFNLK
jgi:hypothetical protein